MSVQSFFIRMAFAAIRTAQASGYSFRPSLWLMGYDLLYFVNAFTMITRINAFGVL
jgi:hypothetical protein